MGSTDQVAKAEADRDHAALLIGGPVLPAQIIPSCLGMGFPAVILSK